MKTIVHKLANGGIGNYPPNPDVVQVMTGDGWGWGPERRAREAAKFTIPSDDKTWPGFSAAFAAEWVAALSEGGLTEAQALGLFIRRQQLRRGYTESAIIDDETLPDHVTGDRYFRDALKWDASDPSKCKCDMPTARGIHMDRIRIVRDRELAALDIPYMRAVEVGDTDAQAAIAKQKQVLRDIPQTFDLTTGTTGQLKQKWPEGLPDREA
jgi:hypothetical protein